MNNSVCGSDVSSHYLYVIRRKHHLVNHSKRPRYLRQVELAIAKLFQSNYRLDYQMDFYGQIVR